MPAPALTDSLSLASVAARIPSLGETMTLVVIGCAAGLRGHRIAHQIPHYLHRLQKCPFTGLYRFDPQR